MSSPFLAAVGHMMVADYLEAVAGGGTPANAYVAEDGATFYVAEDGATYYVQES
jgi:hypothetical protein